MKKLQISKGQVFTQLTVLSADRIKINKSSYVQCKCSCGKITNVGASDLYKGKVKSCGCLSKTKSLKRSQDRRVDLTGKKFDRLLVIDQDKITTSKATKWNCICDCGNKKSITSQCLRSGKTKSCGCLRKELTGQKNFKDLSGKKFGRLKVLDNHKIQKNGIKWECSCECGNIKYIYSKTLLNGSTKSCGCLVVKINKENFTTHGQTNHYLYSTYASMKSRCYNKNEKSYKDYGGRGISVCARWLDGENDLTGFECFLQDMGDRPENHSIDRVDNNGDYCPQNCKWSTRLEQNNNRRPKVFKSKLQAAENTIKDLQQELDYYKQEYTLILEDNKRLQSLTKLTF